MDERIEGGEVESSLGEVLAGRWGGWRYPVSLSVKGQEALNFTPRIFPSNLGLATNCTERRQLPKSSFVSFSGLSVEDFDICKVRSYSPKRGPFTLMH